MVALIVLGSIVFQIFMVSMTMRLLILRWTRLGGNVITAQNGDRGLAVFGAFLLGMLWPLSFPIYWVVESVDRTLAREKIQKREEAMRLSRELRSWAEIADTSTGPERDFALDMIDRIRAASK